MRLTKTLVAGAAFVAFAMGTVAARAETVLRMNNWLPPHHSQVVHTMVPWAKQVEEATKGSVKVQLTDASLGAPPRQYDLAVDGVVDVVFGVLGYTPGRFQLYKMAEMPGAEKAEAVSAALWRTYKTHFEKADEYKDVVLLALFAHGSSRILTSERVGPVTTLDAYKGKKIRVGGAAAELVNAGLGGTNVSAPANEVYEMMSNGVVDGTLLPFEAYPSFNLKGVVKYAASVPGGLQFGIWFAAMNKEAFARLSAEEQQALMSVSGEALSRLGAQTFDNADTAAREQMVADGVTLVDVEPSFVEGLQRVLVPFEQEWLATADKLGVDGKAALAMLREETAKVDAELKAAAK